MKATINEAKEALDRVIGKSRVHLYKPIQIAEILYHHRIYNDIDLSNLKDYRIVSRKWRDAMCIPLLGRVCNSTIGFQDDLFNPNAIPPTVLETLGEQNIATSGAVEAYIYQRFIGKHYQLSKALGYCLDATPSDFYVKEFIDSFWNEAGLRRSLDKIYEIIVYALFTTLVEALELQVEISVAQKAFPLLKEFEDFSQKVMCIDTQKVSHKQDATVYRVGVTNAADRGLDMYSNWGVAIQIKHLGLNVELAESIVNSVSSNRIVIVCKDAEKDVIVSLLTQIGWKNRIQSIVTESNLVDWYEKALRGKYAHILSRKLLVTLAEEISLEFPSVNKLPAVLTDRHYENIMDGYWING